MIYALTPNEIRVRPGQTSGEKVCPICGEEVVPKRGDIVVDHFAHQQRSECDDWAENITEWHLHWQAHVEPDRREVCMKHKDDPSETHFADCVSPTGHVVEVQHSSISPEDIMLRETFYNAKSRGVVWVVDARDFWDRIETNVPGYGRRELMGQIRSCLEDSGESGAINYTWNSPRKAWAAARAPIYLDPGRLPHDSRAFDGALFRLLSFSLGDDDRWEDYDPYSNQTQRPKGEGPGGYGAFVSKREFCRRYKLHLPDESERGSREAYPLPSPHVTRKELEKGRYASQNPPVLA